ncbi:Imidazoleglycerol-phosphate dehydratase [Pontibacillus halophilus JSM 076056 = DSM 19796]|uniref:Imidazoleglycerol-phosphate dehydratase n=1 Tax=Pontibacillus halophilus JSM 076056 = DSM 19796 TaxID=1385510 RepID=A0A0A5I4H5_9BACI|nr:hypothetical protein [Pontibacillus halophilus]KGX90727.1 Imidazoleglycerol-phosphate dehydratase [Pontibacillus halophilus JSM 076056 = DSM 19796]
MTSRNGAKGSQNQNSPKRTGNLPGGELNEEYGTDILSGDNNKGKEYRSKKGAKSQLKHPGNH